MGYAFFTGVFFSRDVLKMQHILLQIFIEKFLKKFFLRIYIDFKKKKENWYKTLTL